MTSMRIPQSRCRFAIARRDITPPVGIYHRMWGAARHDRAAAVHRPLYATVAIMTHLKLPPDSDPASLDEEQIQVIVALDHCVMGARELHNLRTEIRRHINLPEAAILVVFSHTHAAGLMSLDRAETPGGELIPEYLQSLNESVATATREAFNALTPATIVYGTGSCALANNRDFWDEESQQFVCGFNPAEPGDTALVVGSVHSDEGKCLATIVNYACHPTTLAWDNQAISPDFPGAMRETVENGSSDGAICLFLQGAAGDMGPVEGFVGDLEVAERNGRQLGYAALSALAALPAPGLIYRYAGPVVSGATIGAWEWQKMPADELDKHADWQVVRKSIELPYRPELPTLEETKSEFARLEIEEDAARSAGDTKRAAECRALAERQRRMRSRLEMLPDPNVFPLQVVVAQFGEARWVAVQGEPYNEFQQSLRDRFPEHPLIVMTVANEWGASYLPADADYDKPLYQVDVAVLARGSLERVTSDVIATLDNLE